MKDKTFIAGCSVVIAISLIITIFNVCRHDGNHTLYVKDPGTYSSEESIPRRNMENTKAEFDRQSADFGTIPRDTLISEKFILTNEGDKTLYVLDVNPNCQCTSYEVSPKYAEPGGKIVITLNFSSSNKAGFQDIKSTVRLNTETGIYKLALKGNVKN